MLKSQVYKGLLQTFFSAHKFLERSKGSHDMYSNVSYSLSSCANFIFMSVV